MKKYKGVIPPIITPVDPNENLDEQGFRRLLRHCINKGLHGIFVAGTNGETMALTQEQRDRAIHIAIDEASKDIPVMAGVMDTSTKRVIENIKRLEQMGGTCAVVTPIFYARHTDQSETIRHFEKVSQSTDLDILIYNIPTFTGINISFESLKIIASMDHIVGYKDSSGNFADFMKCLIYFEDKEICLLQGSTPLAGVSMLMGADGFIPSISPLFPSLFVEFFNAGKSGNISRTKQLNALISDTSSILSMSKNQISANKFAISQLGFTDKRVLEPLDPVTPEEERRICSKIDEVMNKAHAMGISMC